MSLVDRIAAATGLSQILTRQQAKQGGVVKEPATATAKTKLDSAEAPVAVKNADLAGKVLSSSSEALKGVSENLTKALAAAHEALDASPERREGLAQQVDLFLKRSRDFIDKATVDGLTLVGRGARPLSVATTAEGGHIVIPKAPHIGIDLLGKTNWLDRQAIQSSVNDLQNALIILSNTRTQFAQAQNTLAVAAELNRKSALTDTRARAADATAIILAADHAEWEAEARRTVAEEADREAALREAYGRQIAAEKK